MCDSEDCLREMRGFPDAVREYKREQKGGRITGEGGRLGSNECEGCYIGISDEGALASPDNERRDPSKSDESVDCAVDGTRKGSSLDVEGREERGLKEERCRRGWDGVWYPEIDAQRKHWKMRGELGDMARA